MSVTVPAQLEPVRTWLHRRRVWIHLPIIIAVAYFVCTRLFLLPPLHPDDWDEDVGLARPPTEIDRTDETVAAIRRIVPMPTVRLPKNAPYADCYVRKQREETKKDPMKGRARLQDPMRLNPFDALRGEWAPDKRFLQGHIVGYLDRPEVDQALDEIASLSDAPFCLTAKDGMADEKPHGYAWVIHPPGVVQFLLIVRARRRMAEKHDAACALDDIKAVMKLAMPKEYGQKYGRLTHGGGFGSVWGLGEVKHWLREYRLSQAIKGDFLQWLIAYPYDWRREWRRGLRGERMYLERNTSAVCNATLVKKVPDSSYLRLALSLLMWYAL